MLESVTIKTTIFKSTMRNPNIISGKNNQQGILLIEVMFAILIFSFGILGLVGLQVIATQNSLNAENRTRAALLANEVVSQIWLSKGINNLPNATLNNCISTTSITSNTYLPNATCGVAVNGNAATVTVTWKDPGKTSSANGNQYITKVTVP